LTQQKEEIQSKMLQEVKDEELTTLQGLHSQLIEQYEAIIKQKIDIFTQMIQNLKTITDGNSQFIQGEEVLANKRLEIEIWERDIYQKKRVSLDIQKEIESVLGLIAQDEQAIADRKNRIQEL